VLEFRVPARGTVTQTIPLKNPTAKDISVKASFVGEQNRLSQAFSSPVLE